MIRQAYLCDAPTLSVGVMVCAPTGKGFAVRFEGFTIASA
jgi:regulation of enolase protein 1 (concanavalin A-like superfamily)